VLRTAHRLFVPVAKSKRIDMVLNLPEAAAQVRVDEESLRRVVTNLVSNALKYTPEGGEVRLGLRDSPQEVSFWVSDTGYGIPAQDLPHLFTKFYRVGQRENGQRIPGSGLGLAIAKKAVEAMGGSISVQSELKKGSTFSVVIPKAPPPEPGGKP